MPRVLGPPSEYFAQQIQDLRTQLYASQTSGKNMGAQSQMKLGPFSSSTTYPGVVPVGGPTVKAQLGVSGDAVIWLTGLLQAPSGTAAVIQATVDGTIIGGGLSVAGPGTVYITTSGFTQLSAWSQTVSQGIHTFGVRLEDQTGGVGCTFGNVGILVIPV